ncbi:RNA-binding protein 43-like isoform X2 [Colossoma macropomum]|uniref:RNA-binding protein 43-like isoform X2 n=1 Tax=Colossoma macropomum TaxID=42526 RepID=UPI0018648A46|nr:RNA-binding protein 43-like isoform X2 [Colossoma macropomum]
MSDVSMMSSEGSSDWSRTVVVAGVPDVLSSERMSDKLTIHFQSARSQGGDVKEVQYPTHLKGVAFITFENWQDADRVVECNQMLKDKEFDEEYPLTVYKFTPEVTFYAYADMDLSLFPDLSTLITSMRSTYKSVRFKPSLTKVGFVSAEGPFSAFRELRKDLLSRAQSLRDMQPSPDKAGPSRSVVEEKNRTEETVSLWLDTHVYMYIQMMDKREWDRCVGGHHVTAQAVSTDSCIEVIGPSFSSHLFCERVKKATDGLWV